MLGSSSQSFPDERKDALLGLERAEYERYLPLVRRVALRTASGSLPKNVTYDDVLRAGWAGLVKALGRREARSDADFESYAAYGVRLSVLEYLEAQDPVTRQLRTTSERISTAIGELVAVFGRAPEESEVARHLGITGEQYSSLLVQILERGLVRLDLPNEARDPHGTKEHMATKMARIITALPDQYQIVLGLYYQEKCDHQEIGDVLGLDEGRARELHAHAIHLVRGQLSPGASS